MIRTQENARRNNNKLPWYYIGVASDPPVDLFDRRLEWEALSRWALDPTPGLQVAVVWGRRRQGKSYLLRRLCAATAGLYHQAIEHATPQSLDELGARVGEHLGVGRLAFADWDEAISSLARLAPRTHAQLGAFALGTVPLGGSAVTAPAVVVLDEFPYLMREASELPSVIQRAVDRSLDEATPPVRLVLCGSALSLMSELLTPRSPIHGRVWLQQLVKPFGYDDAAAFWGIAEPSLALRVFAVVGGTPAYRTLVRSRPQSLEDFDRWVVEDVLDPTSALFRDDEILLAEDVEVSSRTIYRSILSAVARGDSTQSKIAASVGRQINAVQFPLESLVRAGILLKDEDAIRQRRPTYTIAEPLVRFHQAVRDPDAARFEDGDRAAAWNDAESRFRSNVLGPAWEELARDYVRLHDVALQGEPLIRVGRTSVSNPASRTEAEVDVVGLGRSSGPRRKRVRILGEAKLRTLGMSDLRRLEELRGRLSRGPVEADDARLFLASASGFEPDLIERAEELDEVRLVSPETLYGRSAGG